MSENVDSESGEKYAIRNHLQMKTSVVMDYGLYFTQN